MGVTENARVFVCIGNGWLQSVNERWEETE